MNRQFFLAKIFLGDSKNFGKAKHSDLKKAPSKPDGSNYDSVIGMTDESEIYILYNNLQVYPSFLITYELINGGRFE